MRMVWQLPAMHSGSATPRPDISDKRQRARAGTRQQNLHAKLPQDEMVLGHDLQAAASIQQARRPVNIISTDGLWKLQFDAHEYASATRFPLLVLEGDAKCGKSQVACYLFGQRRTYDCNWQGVTQPELCSYDWRVSKAIVGIAAEGESEAASDSQEEPVLRHRRSGGRPLHAQEQNGRGGGDDETEAA